MINIGLIGCGYISKKHIDTIGKFEAFHLVAVSDIQEKRMGAAIQQYKELKKEQIAISSYKNHVDLLHQSNVDVVVISVLSGLHAEIAKQAILLGKHVIIEKPLALSLKEANELIALAEENQKLILVCHQLRYHPLLKRIKSLIDNHCLGKLYLGAVDIRINRNAAYYAAADWRGTWDLDGGMLLNQGIHLIDLLTWYFGKVTSVYGEIITSNTSKETEDIATGIISFENKAKGVIEANTITKPENLGYYLSIFGEKGSICIGGKNLMTILHCHIDDYPNVETELKELSNNNEEHYLMYENFLRAFQGKDKLLMSGEAGKTSLETIFSFYKSNLQQTPVVLPLIDFSTKEMIHSTKITSKEEKT